MLTMRFNFRPVSVNSSLASHKGRLIKTKKSRDFKSDMEYELIKYRKDIREFKDSFTLGNNWFLSIAVCFYDSKFYTKKGKVNEKTLDTDNILKAIKDIIASEIGIDDVYFKKNYSDSQPATDGDY